MKSAQSLFCRMQKRWLLSAVRAFKCGARRPSKNSSWRKRHVKRRTTASKSNREKENHDSKVVHLSAPQQRHAHAEVSTDHCEAADQFFSQPRSQRDQ